MRSVHLLVVLSVGVVVVAWLVFSSGNDHRRPIVADPTADLVIGEPIVWENLTIFPVSSKVPKHSDRFITLDEGLKAGTVEILERGAAGGGAPAAGADPFAAPGGDPLTEPGADPFGTPDRTQEASDAPAAAEGRDPFEAPAIAPNASDANAPVNAAVEPPQLPELPELRLGNSVNELMVVNRSEKPLYLMPGEVVIGGDQDRAIAEELVIAPLSEPMAIRVYCVEHGRWGGRNASDYARILSPSDREGMRFAAVDLASSTAVAGFAGNLSLVVEETQLVEQANAGKFIGSVGSLNKEARVAVQAGEDQGKVWDEVAHQNAKADVEVETGTFTANYSAAESLERLAPYLKQLELPVSETPNVVGVIVAVNGKMESMDVFESTPLFQKLWPKLLKSYALDAASAEPAEGNAKAVAVADARAFLRDIASAKSNRDDSKGNLAVSRSESDDVLLFTVHERRKSDSPAAVMGGMSMGGSIGDAVHSAGYSK